MKAEARTSYCYTVRTENALETAKEEIAALTEKLNNAAVAEAKLSAQVEELLNYLPGLTLSDLDVLDVEKQ